MSAHYHAPAPCPSTGCRTLQGVIRRNHKREASIVRGRSIAYIRHYILPHFFLSFICPTFQLALILPFFCPSDFRPADLSLTAQHAVDKLPTSLFHYARIILPWRRVFKPSVFSLPCLFPEYLEFTFKVIRMLLLVSKAQFLADAKCQEIFRDVSSTKFPTSSSCWRWRSSHLGSLYSKTRRCLATIPY